MRDIPTFGCPPLSFLRLKASNPRLQTPFRHAKGLDLGLKGIQWQLTSCQQLPVEHKRGILGLYHTLGSFNEKV